MSLLAIGFAFALATASSTPAEAPANDTTPAPAEAAKPRKICTKERPMGSNMPRRVCRDAAAAAEQGERARDVMRDAQRNRYSPPTQDL